MYFPYDFLSILFSSLLILRIQYIIHATYKTCVNCLFVLSVRLPVNGRLSVVKF